MHILPPETDNCPSWISGRERMTVENISWSSSMKECCRPRRGLNPRPPGLQLNAASNWATEAKNWSDLCNFFSRVNAGIAQKIFSVFFVVVFFPLILIIDVLQQYCANFRKKCTYGTCLFVCVEVLRPSQPNEVMSSVVSLPNHTFTGQA